jgi:hypothetical protein
MVGMTTNKVASIHVAKAVKDLAIETVSIATGADGDDVFIDLETVGDRFPQESDYPQDWDKQVIKDLRECVEGAHKLEAEYLHLY